MLLRSKLFLSSGVLFILLSSLLVVVVEADSTMWTRTYGGEDGDSAFSLVTTPDGGYAVTGYTDSFGSGYYDAWLVKIDASGNMEWNKTYEEGSFYSSLVETSDGGYALAGVKYSSGAGTDGFLIKTDESGKIEWNQTYGGTEDDGVCSLFVTSDKGYVMAGSTESFGAENDDFWLIKTDECGIIQWNQTYVEPRMDSAQSLVKASDGGYVIAGYTLIPGPSMSMKYGDILVIKTDEYCVVPEFSAWMIPPLLAIATLAAIIYKRKLFNYSP